MVITDILGPCFSYSREDDRTAKNCDESRPDKGNGCRVISILDRSQQSRRDELRWVIKNRGECPNNGALLLPCPVRLHGEKRDPGESKQTSEGKDSANRGGEMNIFFHDC
jgi:hypothetical protein